MESIRTLSGLPYIGIILMYEGLEGIARVSSLPSKLGPMTSYSSSVIGSLCV